MSLRVFKHKRLAIGVAVALWIPAVGFGLNVLWKYSTTPGRAAEPPLEWPRRAPVALKADRATLLMFVHPQCGCSDATVGELSILMTHAGAKVDADVFFFYPHQESAAWAHTELWNAAAAIPGVHVFEDRDAEIAQSFGSFTSGQTLVYGPRGKLRFKGGITASRGHSGDNAGRSAIAALLDGKAAPASTPVVTPVFGCSLTGE